MVSKPNQTKPISQVILIQSIGRGTLLLGVLRVSAILLESKNEMASSISAMSLDFLFLSLGELAPYQL